MKAGERLSTQGGPSVSRKVARTRIRIPAGSYAARVPRLLPLNGAPGSGKSTLAHRFAQDHPLALAMAETQLCTGHDVVVPQYLGRLDFVETLHDLAVGVDADFVELALVSNRDDVVRRFERCSTTSQEPAHQQAAELQRRSGGPAQLAATHDRLLAVIAARPATRAITTVDARDGPAVTPHATCHSRPV